MQIGIHQFAAVGGEIPPCQQEQLVFMLSGGRQKGTPFHYVQPDIHSHILQLGLNDFSHAHIIRRVGGVQYQFQTPGIPGPAQQFFGLPGVERITRIFNRGIVTEHLRPDNPVRSEPQPVQCAHIGIPIDGVGKSLSHQKVIQGSHLVIETKIINSSSWLNNEFHIRVKIQPGRLLRRNIYHEIDISGFQHSRDSGHECIDPGRSSPVIFVSHQRNPITGYTLGEFKGTGTHRVVHHAAVLFHRRGAHNRRIRMAEGRKHRPVGCRGGEFYRVFIDNLNRFHRFEDARPGRGNFGIHDTFEGELHRLGVKWCTVVKAYALS